MAAGDVSVSITRPRSLYSAFFDGTDDRITFVRRPVTTLKGLPFSVSFWCIFKSISATSGTCLDFDISTSDLFCCSQSNADLNFGVYNGASYIGGRKLTITANVWTNIVYTFDGGTTGKAYLNGIDNSAAGAPSSGVQADKYFIGSRTSAANFLKGNIKDVVFYNRVLTDAEAIITASGAYVEDGAILRFKLKDDFNDMIGNNHGTAVGSVLQNLEDTAAAAIKAQRAGATDKYLCEEINGQILAATIQET